MKYLYLLAISLLFSTAANASMVMQKNCGHKSFISENENKVSFTCKTSTKSSGSVSSSSRSMELSATFTLSSDKKVATIIHSKHRDMKIILKCETGWAGEGSTIHCEK